MENLNDRLFEFDKVKTQSITLAQLERTHKENDVYGNPLKGIYHYQLIMDILKMCENHGLETDVWDLFAAHNKGRYDAGVVTLPQVEAEYGKGAPEAHILRRVFANVRITNFDDSENTTNLAIAFHQRGIQVGFGNNVIICHNQCMLSPDKYVATYSEHGRGDRTELPLLMDTVNGWLAEAQTNVMRDRERIDAMQNIKVDFETTMQMVGELTRLRILHDTKNKALRDLSTYPLNQGQISDFTEQMLVHYDTKDKVTLWDVYNSATNLYHARQMDIPAMMPQNRACVEYLESKFNF